ncbi:MAG TPA: hypothetical protein VEK32_17370 [Thermodesulfobacteriota bacterium]|nr:hypothetical protein [Thermodesulfobacteriota bacterium]
MREGDRYTTYPKNREKKRVRIQDLRFLHRSYEWLKWTILSIGGFTIHIPRSRA